jgi:DNA-binding beta-propeller fold protein YncE
MAYPEGVAVDDLGRVFVADTGNNRILRFDQAGIFLGEFGGFGFEPDRFDKPRDLVINRSLSLWVLDGENARVVKYDLEGRLIGVGVDFESGQAQGLLGRVLPGGLAGEPGGFLYLTDTAGDRLITLNPLGGGVNVLGGYGSQPGRFRHPTGVTVSGKGTILVGDGGNGRVQALDSFGSFLRAWPLVGGEQREDRVAVCWLPGARLAIAERDSSRLTVMSQDGHLLARLDARGSGRAQLDHPSALAADQLGRLYVADTENHRVQVFRLVERPAAAPR